MVSIDLRTLADAGLGEKLVTRRKTTRFLAPRLVVVPFQRTLKEEQFRRNTMFRFKHIA
jgi:hypothetical protein